MLDASKSEDSPCGMSSAPRCRAAGVGAGQSMPGPLDVSRTAQCAECGHALIDDHSLVVKGRADPTMQFAAIATSGGKKPRA
jgi:hypothetical protein